MCLVDNEGHKFSTRFPKANLDLVLLVANSSQISLPVTVTCLPGKTKSSTCFSLPAFMVTAGKEFCQNWKNMRTTHVDAFTAKSFKAF